MELRCLLVPTAPGRDTTRRQAQQRACMPIYRLSWRTEVSCVQGRRGEAHLARAAVTCGPHRRGSWQCMCGGAVPQSKLQVWCGLQNHCRVPRFGHEPEQ